METPPIKHHGSNDRGAFIMEIDGRQVGELTYTMAGNRMTILHTEVDVALRGTGAARKLVGAAAEHARAGNFKIASHCSYASALFEKTPAAYADILAR